MRKPLTADDLLPLVNQLEPEQQLRLAKLAVRAAGMQGGSDAARYVARPAGDDEFARGEDALAWDAEGWEATGAEG